MRIDWAMFGERRGGHALLAASGNPLFAGRITQYTDRPGDPPVGLNWGPVITGFFFSDHYVLLQTFHDPTAGRAGMVRSYAAYIPATALALLGNLSSIFLRLPQTLIESDRSIEPLEIAESVLAETKLVSGPGLIAIAKQVGALLPTVPVVWASTEQYLPTIDSFWGRLPASLRPAFAFAFQFAPEHNLPVKPRLVATLPELSSRWPAENIIRLQDTNGTPLNATQSWFAGLSEGDAFNRALAEYGIFAEDFGELNLLSEFADLTHRLPNLSFSETKRAVRILEKYSRAKKITAPHSKKLFEHLCSLVATASPEDIATLRNMDNDALSELILPLQRTITLWLQSAILSDRLLLSLKLALESPGSWWAEPFLTWLDNLTKGHSEAEAQILCRVLYLKEAVERILWRLNDTLETEDKLVSALPNELDKEHAENLIHVAMARSWMRLHALCLLRSRGEDEAISLHAKAAGGSTGGFVLLEQRLGFPALVNAACMGGDENLIRYVGGLLQKNVAMLDSPIFLDGTHWCSILAQAVSRANGAIVGRLRSLVLNTLQQTGDLPVGYSLLCEACNSKDPSLWLDLEYPDTVLSRRPPELRAGTVIAVNRHVVAEIKALRPFVLKNDNAFREILNSDTILQALSGVPLSEAAKAGANAFRSIPFLGDEMCCRWLIDLFTRSHYARLSISDAVEIAALLRTREYPQSAQIVCDTAEKYFRGDVEPIYHAIRYKYHMAKHQQSKSQRKKRLPKVVIATALPLERTEVIKHLGSTEYDVEYFADVAAWPSQQPIFEVWVLTTGAGNLQAQKAGLRVLKPLKPKFAFFVGIGGGLKDSDVGDVTYSSKVYYYEGGKEEDDGMKSRPSIENSSEDLVQLAHRIADKAWQPEDGDTGVKLPKATSAVVASGENVLTSVGPTAATFQHIKSKYNDTQIVEMEGYGFLSACRDARIPQSMVIRGVSDRLRDKAESDAKGNQPLAAKNAAAFLFALLRDCQGILAPKKRKKFFGLF